MGMGAAYQGAIDHAGEFDIIDIDTFALDESWIFFAFTGTPDAL